MKQESTIKHCERTGLNKNRKADYGLLADTRKTPPLPPLEPYVRRQVEDVVLGLNRRIVNREAESFSVKNLIHALHGFGDGITADA